MPDLNMCVWLCGAQCEQYRDSILLDPNWEKAHFAFGRYLDQLYTDAKQREVRVWAAGLRIRCFELRRQWTR